MITDQMTSLMSIAAIRFDQHYFSAAARDFQQALQLARRQGNQQEVAFSLSGLAQTAIEEGDFALSRKVQQRSNRAQACYW